MKYLIFILIFLAFLLSAAAAFAADPPLFSCENPVGEVTASYSSGTHGVPGDTTRYYGSDDVYKIDDIHTLQCLCIQDRDTGIESNWWKASSLSPEERETYVRRGWIFVEDGSRWGLDKAPYLVKNDDFSCGGRGGRDNDDDDDKKESKSIGEVLSATTLAATGDTKTLLFFALGSVLFAWATYRLSRE